MVTDSTRCKGKSLADASPDSSRAQFLRCFRPLHILSSTFALWPFAAHEWTGPVAGGTGCTRCSVLYVFAIVTAYSAFHLYINYTDGYGIAPNETSADSQMAPTATTQQQVEANFVSIVIDIYNRYSGLVLFWLLHTVALATQRSLVAIVSGVLLIDAQIVQRLSLVPNHAQWCRSICLHTAFIFLAIGVSEYHNCIMYMSDYIPASEYCIFQCFITMLTSSTVEIQYVAFVQLIKNRLQLINELLGELSAYTSDEEQTHYDRFRLERSTKSIHPRDCAAGGKTTATGHSPEFLCEITPSYPRAHQSLTDPGLSTNPFAKRDPPAAGQPSIPRGDRQWHKIRQQHKIITVNQAPPSRSQNAPGDGDGERGTLSGQFPLLVASLMHSQSKACEHIRTKIINDIKNLYTHLHLLSLHINKAYGAQLIFILLTLFVTLTTLLYYCTMKLFRMLWMGRWASSSELMLTFWAVLSTLSWAFISTFRILRICNVCNSAKNEAQKIGSLIHGLGWKTNCPDTKSMVRILSLQLQQQRIEFTAGGLFTIDHGLMFNIVGSLATYLLILIQFDIAQNGAKWKAEQPAAGGFTKQPELS
ncbi:gustatory receptor for bitter taste 66a-like [Anopheles moucheti]|uniref:gustatory receptor for bitter taste 66a-like n=1 Tax=Anopheles moucheti TaxID=186751 RepID=UPI0022F0E73A|nr:gustatory receptor for bitter taste 66a-like [Anopheles moucheti]